MSPKKSCPPNKSKYGLHHGKLFVVSSRYSKYRWMGGITCAIA